MTKLVQYLIISTWVIGVIAIMNACGSDYQAYEIEKTADADGGDDNATDDATDDGTDADPCATALTAWEGGMKDTVDNRCAVAGCHAQAQLDLGAFNANDDDANRAVLEAWTGSDVTKLTKQIHANPAHSGGDFTTVLPAADISTWHAAEIECE